MADPLSRRDILDMTQSLHNDVAEVKQILQSVNVERVVRLESLATDTAGDVAEIKGLLRDQNGAVRVNQKVLEGLSAKLAEACKVADRADKRSESNGLAIREMATWVKICGGLGGLGTVIGVIVGMVVLFAG